MWIKLMMTNINVINLEQYNLIRQKFFKQINDEFISNDIFWWIHSGTLLGAMRNNKFLPWDDDIDMAMTIKEFYSKKELIRKIAEKNNFTLYDRKNHLGMDVCRMFSNERYILEFNGSKYHIMPFIDIMLAAPVKKMSYMKRKWWKWTNNFNYLFSDFYSVYYRYVRINNKFKKNKWYYNFLLFILKVIFIPFWFLPLYHHIFLSRKAKSNNIDKFSLYYNYDNLGIIYNYNDFYKINFENTFVNVNRNFNLELTKRYGKKWKDEPPVEMQFPKHVLYSPVDGGEYKIAPYLVK